MIDIRKLKELVRLMVENELSELDLRDQEETVTIRRGSDGVPAVSGQPYMYGAPPAPAAARAPAPSGGGSSGSTSSDEGLIAIESPMVGTFYSRPDPDTDAFTSVGASVSADSVVCLVEAMKVFNEIKAGSSGTIAKICVNDGDAVEFGQPLFMVKPN